MDCKTAREIYYFLQSGEAKDIDQEKKAEAEKHLEECSECRSLFPDLFEEEEED